jgi:hypothetical protein
MNTLAELIFSAHLSGEVNRADIRLDGDGTINQTIGQTIGNYNLQKIPDSFPPYFLSACLITGYPNASASIDGCRNIFQGHPYSYTRTIKFRTGEVLILEADCKLDGDKLISNFELQGSSPLGDTHSIEPLIESWEPVGPGKVRGHFTAAWKNKTGGFIVADATTDYRIEAQDEQSDFLHRYVAITSSAKGNRLFKKQDVRLFKQLCSPSS